MEENKPSKIVRYGGGFVIFCFALSIIGWAVTTSTPNTPASSEAPITPSAEIQPQQDQPQEQERTPANLNEAIGANINRMADFDETQISVGALSLAIWSSENMKWSELQALPTAKYGMVMKESDSERGKKICVTGNVVEISADSSGPQKVYLGGMADEQFHIYRFIAVGSTGEIVAGSNSRFCGVVTGKNDYSNSAGGVAHAIHLVGMFDLPENNPNKVGTSNTRHHKEHEIRLQDGTTGTVIDD